MKVQFATSIAGATFSYIEGQTLDLPTPTPSQFVTWLREGIVKPVRDAMDVALAPGAVERAVARRGSAAFPRGSRRGARAGADPDGAP